MAKNILTFALADNGEVYVYSEPDSLTSDGLEAVLDPNRDDFEYQVQEYALHGVREALLSRQAH